MSKIKAIDGLPVMDARKPIVIHVKKSDCKGADPLNPASCAAARAWRREYGVKEVRIHVGRAYVLNRAGKAWTRYAVPGSLRIELIAFDRGGRFAPGEFRLAVPTPSKRLGKRYGSSKPYRKGTGKKRAAKHFVADIRHGPGAAA